MKHLVLTLLAALSLSALAADANAATRRSQSARVQFIRAHPCPSTGANHFPCPGYVVDHIVPLCAGGADKPSNMQWQERAASYVKDAQERKQCAAMRK